VALEVGAPEHLLHEHAGIRETVPRQHGRKHLSLREQPVPQIGRQPGDIAALVRATVMVAPVGIVRASLRQEACEALKAGDRVVIVTTGGKARVTRAPGTTPSGASGTSGQPVAPAQRS
jgi:hypothetical protein